MNKRFIGLDVGTKRIGVAITDPEGLIAVPVETYERKSLREDIEFISSLVLKYSADCIVVGLPVSLDGSCGPQMRTVQHFINHLARNINIPISTWDERLTTVAADKMMLESSTRKSKKKMMRDALAAAYILQGYVDRLRRETIG